MSLRYSIEWAASILAGVAVIWGAVKAWGRYVSGPPEERLAAVEKQVGVGPNTPDDPRTLYMRVCAIEATCRMEASTLERIEGRLSALERQGEDTKDEMAGLNDRLAALSVKVGELAGKIDVAIDLMEKSK